MLVVTFSIVAFHLIRHDHWSIRAPGQTAGSFCNPTPQPVGSGGGIEKAC